MISALSGSGATLALVSLVSRQTGITPESMMMFDRNFIML